MRENFRNIPHYSSYFLKTLTSPPLLFFVLFGNLCLMIGVFVFFKNEVNVNPNVNHFFDALWWGLSTVTTVGYGDIIPVTIAGKLAGIFLMLSGLVLFISYSALFVSIFFSYIEKDFTAVQKVTYKEFEQIMVELKDIKDQLSKLK